jgi:hypothetical protein
MAKEKRHYATEEEIADLMAKNSWTRDDAEFYLIDKYNEVVFPDETDEVIDEHKQNLKVANVYDNKKGKRKITRKPDEDKRELMSMLVETFQNYDDFKVVSEEGKMKFVYNNRHFTLTLTWNRKEDKNG